MPQLTIRVTPNARTNEIKELGPNNYRAWVACPPADGEANERLIELLADHFNTAKSRFTIIRGLSSRNKIIDFDVE